MNLCERERYEIEKRRMKTLYEMPLKEGSMENDELKEVLRIMQQKGFINDWKRGGPVGDWEGGRKKR